MMRTHLALALLCSMALAGCTTTASRELVLAVEGYDARSREAIAAVEEIERKAVEQPPVAEAEAQQRFASDILNPGAQMSEAYVRNRMHPDATTVSSAALSIPALEEMRCVHSHFTRTFADVQAAGIFGKRPVAERAPEVLDQLIAQQLLLAKLVQGPAHADLMAYKADLAAKMERVRDGTATEAQKREALYALRSQWLAVEEVEERLTTEAVSGLVKAAATGVSLRKQLVGYGKWSLSDIVDSARGLTSFVTTVSGRDLAALDGRVDELRQQVEQDPDLAGSARTILASLDVPRAAPIASTLGIAASAPGVEPARRAEPAVRTPTPCLDRLRNTPVETGSLEGTGNGGQ